ncbi:hypothetical protein K491DRAFT_721179 [Lophiostoma macrostomum CBS 122681]|uniref:F-box domain-containing protein n=1 Tax=Lophiostoma macrostomum CBS 122681 TaxID=1314788 RepID=A0A6A6SSL8_9PLEO|nr:hypothetical protein K491DRAFT_721179 [Lophiostoma macrostomum CBS 122681]
MASHIYDDMIPPETRLDLLQHRWPVPATGFEDLPNELLDMIAEKLLNGDLASLTRASKRFFEIAQELLYTDIYIRHTRYNKYRMRPWGRRESAEEESRVTLLFDALAKRPSLARKVRKLLIWPRYINVEFRMNTITGLQIPAYKGIKAPMKECLIVGLLLSLLPELRYLNLHLDLYRSGICVPFFEHCMLSSLFGEATDISVADLSSVPGLAKLQVLRINSCQMHMDWCRLPSLERVEIGSLAYMANIHHGVQISTVLWFFLLLDEKTIRGRWDGHIDFLSRFHSLKKLTVVIPHNNSHSSGGYCAWTRLHDLADSVHAHLEDLELSHGREPDWTKHVQPIPSLVSFMSVRTLKLPQDALLGSEYGTDSEDRYRIQQLSVAQLLPSKIATLVVWFPTTIILVWLNELLAHRSSVASLSHVTFKCSNRFKNDYYSFSTALYSSPTYIELGKAGIKASVLSLGDLLYEYE